jgi:two-component system phosphate regulon sensor histidine kinase PhoR
MKMLPWLLLLATVVVVAWVESSRRKRIRRLTRMIDGASTARPMSPPFDGSGEVGRLQAAVTALAKRLHNQLARSLAEQGRLEAVLSGMVEGVLVIDGTGTVLLSNQRAETLLELPPDHGYIGRSLIELTRHPDLHDLVRWVMSEGGLSNPSSREITLDGGQHHILQVTATPIEDAAETGRAFILVFHDISDLKRLERIRRDFVANVSHELRTPLAAISGYTETLLNGALEDPEHARRFLGIIERHAERLGRLVTDLLALSDLELGRTELRRRTVDVDVVTEATFEVLRQKATSRGITLEQAIGPDAFVHADADRLEQALLNLVDNAIKYTPRGGHVTVTARRLDDSKSRIKGMRPEGPIVEIAVSDTGIGVPEQDLPRLTERFYCVDKARSRDLGGTGLGLAIVKHIVQAHGGWMGIESKLNQGTTVHLWLPAPVAVEEELEPKRTARA